MTSRKFHEQKNPYTSSKKNSLKMEMSFFKTTRMRKFEKNVDAVKMAKLCLKQTSLNSKKQVKRKGKN